MSDPMNPNGPAPEGGTPQGPAPSGRSGNWTDSVSKDLVEQYGEQLGRFDSYRGFVEGSIGAMNELSEYKTKFDGRTMAPSKEDSGETWNSFWGKLGKPAEASGYGIEEDSLSGIYHKANLTADQAKVLSDGLVSFNETAEKEYQDTRKSNYDKAITTLREKHGEKLDEKLRSANQALTNLGGDSLVALIKDKGLDNDPDMIGFFMGLGDLMQEGSIPAGQNAPGGKNGFAGSYDSMKGLD